ncbi:hypothetical protein M8J77_003060 [Diaphorina citri]|nr:hypothetical protein M8J77_003060 [Diaphorina citri]
MVLKFPFQNIETSRKACREDKSNGKKVENYINILFHSMNLCEKLKTKSSKNMARELLVRNNKEALPADIASRQSGFDQRSQVKRNSKPVPTGRGNRKFVILIPNCPRRCGN